ncbi:ACT domain-containing protein [Fructobacillus sp. M2-14]|uniref:UPF0237 protein G6R29_01185 n=1 Tax=Fructobacillus broussonetiae TaxID=2713173 RepID=A0ABS5QYH1_9LACO|nr:ACT domain-containing protein [Fructobacillus broussonetiae]MBS9338248.1 ACT domain-containing protein [Fructobacillus broussonetiae]
MQAVVTAVGKDKAGIVAGIATCLSENNANILDLSQTIMGSTFTMSMLVNIEKDDKFNDVHEALKAAGDKLGVTVHVQREELFDSMARV